MLRFWRNPEFVRHVRADLRPPRAITAALLVLIICALVGLACWGAERDNLRAFFRLFHAWLLGAQFTLLGFWCASACGQAISRERELKTYDFLKTTRLTAAELLIGKLLGAPVMAYFVVSCSMPISIFAGVLGGYGVGVLLGAYILLAVFALFVGLLCLWMSMLVEKSSVGAIGFLGIFPIAWAFGLVYGPFPGFGAISIFPALFSLYKVNSDVGRMKATLFGFTTSYLALTLLLYTAFGVWLVLMLIRNLKRDRDQIRLLSRWQAVGLGAFLNLLFYGFLDPKLLIAKPNSGELGPEGISRLAVGLNGFILFLVGLATLTPQERLKVWWRRRLEGQERYFSESGLPWPWLVAAAMAAYALLAVTGLGTRSAVPLERWRLGTAAIQLLAILIYTTRDILFLQWCNLTRMKRPILKGFLYLCLYYISAAIIAGVASIGSEARGSQVLQLLTPYGVFASERLGPRAASGLYIGLSLQLAITFGILKAISSRLKRPASVAVASAA